MTLASHSVVFDVSHGSPFVVSARDCDKYFAEHQRRETCHWNQLLPRASAAAAAAIKLTRVALKRLLIAHVVARFSQQIC